MLRSGTFELATSEMKFRLLAEHASDVVTKVGLDGTRNYVSPAAARVLGQMPETMIGHTTHENVHPEDEATVGNFQARLLTGAVEADIVHFRFLHPERGEIWLEKRARIIRHPETGAPDGYVAAMRDISERRCFEAEREAYAIELKRTNADLDRLARHLARARDKAEQASGAKSRS